MTHPILSLIVALVAAAPAGAHVSTPATQDPLHDAREALASDDRAARLKALESAFKIGGEGSVDLVLAALADPDPHVADLAQRRLPDLNDPELLTALTGRRGLESKNPAVQLRAAEAIGRLDVEVDAQEILRHVKKRSVRLSRMLLWSLERLADNDLLGGKKERTIKAVRLLTGRGDDDIVRAAAMQALSILDPWDGAISMDNLRNGSGLETASALMDVIDRLRPQGYLGALRRGLDHKKEGVRMRTLDVLMRGPIGRPDLDALIYRLDKEPRAAIRTRIVAALQYFTGHREGEEAEAWKAFAKTLPMEWTAADTKNSFRKRPNVTGTLDRLEELEPSSDRVAILLDVSASYWQETPSGSTIAASMRPELQRLFERLEQTGTFLLVPFADEPIEFSSKPLKCSQANLERAARYLKEELPAAIDRAGQSHIAAAMDHALSFEDVDRIIVVSASSDYVGEHADVELMTSLYRERTRFRPAIFDFVLLNVKAAEPPKWYRLANPRGGRMFRLQVR